MWMFKATYYNDVTEKSRESIIEFMDVSNHKQDNYMHAMAEAVDSMNENETLDDLVLIGY